ncbi:MAG: lamin tail domain-containing protein, partial [Planctomycetes bacterium]|nr:lamin tail domain-containing protein [Planctomycetota bacterium]
VVRVVDGNSASAGGGRHVLDPQLVGPGEFVTVTEAELGFGAQDGDRLFLYSQEQTQLLDARAVSDRLRGLSAVFPEQWLYPDVATPGEENSFTFHDEIAINEIMYHAIGAVSDETGKYEESPEEWIELVNRSSAAVDMSGWRLRDAIDFVFPLGTMLQPDEYLVVAADAVALRGKFPNATIVGNFDRGLSNKSDHIRLVDANNNPADDVRYYDRKPWPEMADGGGSSLELRNPDADNSKAGAWADSNEFDRSSWQTYTIRQTAVDDPGPRRWNEFIFGLLDGGRVLIDDVSVVRNPDVFRTELIQNGTFESDVLGSSPDKWRIIGNHVGTVIADPDDPTNRVLDLLATGPTDHLHNHAETTFVGNAAPIDGRDYEITFRARWISGSNQLNSRFYLSRVAETIRLEVPELHGTPGERNSVFEANIGPTYSHLSHSPVLPDAFADVTVRVAAEDPDGLDSMTLWWSIDGGVPTSTPMSLQADGMMAGTIPGQRAATVVQFYVEGEDSQGATSMFPAAGPDSRALIKFNDGRVNPRPIDTIRVVMTTSEVNSMLNRVNLMSNQQIGATIVVNNSEVYYDIGLRLKGSTFGRPKPERQRNYSIRFHGDQLFRGVLDRISLDGSGNANNTVLVNGQDEIIVKTLMNRAGGIANQHDDLAYVITPRVGQSGTVILQQSLYTNEYLDSRFNAGGDSPLYKLENIRYLVRTDDGTPEGLKYPEERRAISILNDLGDFGDNKEHYRWIFQAQNGRARDEYDRIIELSKALDSPISTLDAATRPLIDAEEWMRVAALYSLFGDNDTLFGANSQNLMFYLRPEDNKFILLAWDQDFSFSYSTSSPLFNPENLGWNIFQLIDLPANERLLYGNMLDLIETSFNADYAAPWAEHLGSLVGQNYSGHVTYIRNRASFVTNRISQLVPETPFEITTNNGAPLTASEVSATLAGNGWVDVREIRLLGSDEPLDVTWTDMDRWQVTVRLDAGENDITLAAYDYQDRLIATDSITVTSTNATLRVRDGLRITEIMFNPADPPPGVALDNDEFEFLELQNVGDDSIDLTGVRFERGLSFEFLAGNDANQLFAGERILLVKNRAAFLSRYSDFDERLIAGEFPSDKLRNRGERITLLDRFGQTILDFSYEDGWYDGIDGQGFSLTIRDAQADVSVWDERGGWRPSSLIGGSPGADDSMAAPDPGAIVINEILTHTDAAPNDWIELHNTTSGPINVGGWLLSDDELSLGKFQIPPGTTIAGGGFLRLTEDDDFGNVLHPGTRTPFAFSELGEQVILSGALPIGTPLGYREDKTFGAAERGVTFGRYVKSTGGSDFVALAFATPDAANAPPLIGPIVIHEIHYQPVDGAAEFVELKNITSEPVSLFDESRPANTWRFTDGITFAFPTGTIVPPDGSVLVVSNDPAEFRADNDVPIEIAIFQRAGGALNNDGESLELSRPGAEEAGGTVPLIVVDRVNYNDRLPWPIEAAGQGASLQRLVAGDYGNDPANWA